MAGFSLIIPVIVKEGADGIGHAVLVRLEPGTYTVKESSWNWAYDGLFYCSFVNGIAFISTNGFQLALRFEMLF